MADEDVNGDSDEVQHEKSQKKVAKYDSGAADLEKVTDYAEEKEITSSDGFSSVSQFSANARGLVNLQLFHVLPLKLDNPRTFTECSLFLQQPFQIFLNILNDNNYLFCST